MSMMTCDRDECDNVFCSRLILSTSTRSGRYICESCFEELLMAKEWWPTQMTKLEVRTRMESFMKSPPGSLVILNGDGIDAEFERLCGKSNE